MYTPTRVLLELIGRLGFRVAIAKDHIEAVNDETGERFIVRGDDIDRVAVELAGTVGCADLLGHLNGSHKSPLRPGPLCQEC